MTRPTRSLATLLAEHQGKASDKWAIYISEYERLFKPYRSRAVKLLEIGIQNGGSLEIWAKYFSKGKKFVGCDINPDCNRLTFDDPRIALVVMDANTDDAEHKILSYTPEFELIIDDGSHRSSDIVATFSRYFPYLKTGGLFIAEDLHCSYWQDFEGGLFRPYSAMAFFKQLADVINHEHWGIPKTRAELIIGFNNEYGIELDEENLSQIHSVEFINSICVIRKEEARENILGARFIAGKEALVADAVLPLHGTFTPEPNQQMNIWAQPQVTIADELSSRLHDIARLKRDIAGMENRIESYKTESLNRQTEHEEIKQTLQKQIAAQLHRETLHNEQLSKLQAQQNTETLQLEHKYHEQIQQTQREQAEHEWLTSERISALDERLQIAQNKLLEREKEFTIRENDYFNQLKDSKAQIEFPLSDKVKDSEDFARQLTDLQARNEQHKNDIEERHSRELKELHRRNAEHEWLTNERIHVLQERLHSAMADMQNREWEYSEREKGFQNQISNIHNALEDSLNRIIVQESEHTKNIQALIKTAQAERDALVRKYEDEKSVVGNRQNDLEWLSAEREAHLNDHVKELQQTHQERENKLQEEIKKILYDKSIKESDLQKEIRSVISKTIEEEQSHRTEMKKLEINYFKKINEITQKHQLEISNIELENIEILSDYHKRLLILDNLTEIIKSQWKDEYTSMNIKISNTTLEHRKKLDQINKHVISISENILAINNKIKENTIEINKNYEKIIDIMSLNNDNFIHEIYKVTLNRPPDAQGYIYYSNRLLKGIKRTEILKQLYNSSERKKQGIKSKQIESIIKKENALNFPIIGAIMIFFGIKSINKEINGTLKSLESSLNEIKEIIRSGKDHDKNHIHSDSTDINTSGTKPIPKAVTREQFDHEWYLEQYPDVAKSGMDAYEHYINLGIYENRLSSSSGFPQLTDANDETLNELCHAVDLKWGRHPLISIIMPTYNTNEDWLRQALDSVLSQVYPNWELCISDDASTDPHVVNIIEEYKSKDNRIKSIFNKINKKVAASSNIALSLATGEYTVLLDHDDILTPDALYYAADTIIKEHPDMFYSDELITDSKGLKIIGHAFRPAFSLELLRSHPYIVHLVGFKTSLLRKIGGFDESLTISQDYDLILRAVEKSFRITHIPRVLYKWRTHESSAGHNEKNNVTDTSMKVLKNHLARSGENGYIEKGSHFNFFETRYTLRDDLKTAIIIPTKNHWKLVKQCIESIENTTANLNIQIFIIDHDSSDKESLSYFKKISEKHAVLKYSGEFNFSTINNWAVNTIGDGFTHYLFCNNDIETEDNGWLARMLELGQKDDVGIVGAKLYYPDKRVIQHAGVCVGLYGAAEHYGKFIEDTNEVNTKNTGYLGALITNHEMSAVTAACMLMKADVFKEVGGFDELAKVGFGDVDICLRTREAGYRVIFCPHASLIHHESISRGKSTTDPHPKDSLYFQNRWSLFIQKGDPYYNPNLTSTNTFWGLRSFDEYSSLPLNALSPRTETFHCKLK